MFSIKLVNDIIVNVRESSFRSLNKYKKRKLQCKTQFSCCKNFVKVTVLPKNLIQNWFDVKNLRSSEFHYCVCERKMTLENYFVKLISENVDLTKFSKCVLFSCAAARCGKMRKFLVGKNLVKSIYTKKSLRNSISRIFFFYKNHKCKILFYHCMVCTNAKLKC